MQVFMEATSQPQEYPFLKDNRLSEAGVSTCVQCVPIS